MAKFIITTPFADLGGAEFSSAFIGFDALCHEYRKVIELLDSFEAEVKRLRQRQALLEEELLTRI